jgi:hypothetical protein
MFYRLIPLALLLSLAACGATPVFAQNKPVSGLTPRGAVVGTDQIPDLPSGTTSLQAIYAKDLKAYTLVSYDSFGADPTGAADSTAAIQAAYDSGLPLTCSGTYKVSGNILIESPNNDGQTTTGGGSYYGAGGQSAFPPVSTGACIIKPTSAVTGGVLVIDGTPFSGGGASTSWVQGFSLANLVIDMSNMLDVATNAAIEQIQAWDGSYTNVRVINDGVNKRAYLAKAGAYTTSLRNFYGNILDFEGTASNNAVTTITVDNFDGGQVIGNYVNGLKIRGGSVQCSACTSFYFRNSGDIQIETDVETIAGGAGGYIYDFDSSVNFVTLRNETQGHVGGYINGTPGQSFANFDRQTNFNSYPFDISFSGFSFNSQGTPGLSAFKSGSAGSYYLLTIGRTGTDALWCVAGVVNDCVSGAQPGDTIFGSNFASENTWLVAAAQAVAKLTSTTIAIQPGVTLNANQVNLESGSASTDEIVCYGLTSCAAIINVIHVANPNYPSSAPGDVAIGSNSGGGRSYILGGGNPAVSYDGTGHQEVIGYPQPTAGTGTASVVGNDSLFVATAGSSVTTSVVNFSTGGAAWASTPSCIVSGNTGAAFPFMSAISTTTVTVGWSASVSGATAIVRCWIHN